MAQKEQPKCQTHDVDLIFDPEGGYYCNLCEQAQFDHIVSIFYCGHCGKKGNHSQTDGDDDYWEFDCLKCGKMTRVYIDMREPDFQEPCDFHKLNQNSGKCLMTNAYDCRKKIVKDNLCVKCKTKLPEVYYNSITGEFNYTKDPRGNFHLECYDRLYIREGGAN